MFCENRNPERQRELCILEQWALGANSPYVRRGGMMTVMVEVTE